jgi:hypothetical protein
MWLSLILKVFTQQHWSFCTMNGLAKSWFVTRIIGLITYGLHKMLHVLPFNDEKARKVVGRTG